MAMNVASADPPMTLGRRQELQQICIPLRVLPHEIVFTPSVGDILNKEQLCAFVDGILRKLAKEQPTIDTPEPGAWKLSTSNNQVDLDNWSPYSLEADMPIFISSKEAERSLPVITAAGTEWGASWGWVSGMQSIELPGGKAFLLKGDTHVLIVLCCQTKVKVSKKASRIEVKKHNVLVPVEFTVPDILGLIRASVVNAVYLDNSGDNSWGNLLSDPRSVREFGWKSGTVLRVELR